jgi:hypothetical protein
MPQLQASNAQPKPSDTPLLRSEEARCPDTQEARLVLEFLAQLRAFANKA